MEITNDGSHLVVRIPLWQDSLDALGEKSGQISNVIGLICGNEQGIARVIDLGYKGSFDYGDFLVKTDYENEKFKNLCDNEWKIGWFEYPICDKCHKPIFGSFTSNSEYRKLCFDCET